MDMGTGKTRVAIELAHSTDCNYVLFLSPFSTKKNLQSEIIKWGLQIDYSIIAYETLSASNRVYLETLDLIKDKRLFIVADESIFIKNEESKRFRRLMRLAEYSEYRLILNGTPITKSEWDLYNQMYFLSPRIIGMSRQEFLNTFFTRVRYKKKFERPKEFYKLSEVNIDYLYKLIEPYVFKVELDFKHKISEYAGFIGFSKETYDKYEELKERLLQDLEDENLILNTLMYMKYVMFTDKRRCKLIADRIKGHCIVFCRYLKEIEYISSEIDCYVITGDTPENERAKITEAFKNDSKPLLMTFGTGAYGLNLQFCNRVVFASLTFDYGKVDQAKGRIRRLGQKRDITYTYYKSFFGLYNMIENNIQNKENIKDLIFKKLKEGDKTWLENI